MLSEAERFIVQAGKDDGNPTLSLTLPYCNDTIGYHII
jgi:hypothetical protein